MNQSKIVLYRITSNKQMPLKMDFSICLIELNHWWEVLSIHELWNTIKQLVRHYGYSQIYVDSHTSQSIWYLDSGHIFITDNSEQLHITTVNKLYQLFNQVNYSRQMVKHNDRYTGLPCLEETLQY